MKRHESGARIRIGVDFDNTLVSYDDLLYRLALERGWIQSELARNKKSIRDCVRELPDGDVKWQQLQAIAYGAGIGGAFMAAGAEMFFGMCKQHGVRLYIVSHKTDYASFDETHTNLREAAINWMKQNRVFDIDGLGVSMEDVFFEPTRAGKVERLTRLWCTHFIDDLEETFLEPSFPPTVEKILYDPHSQHAALPGVRVFRTWKEIGVYFFEARS